VRDPSFFVAGLLDLHKLAPQERRATWRQSMAALARASADDGPGPLDGLHPEALLLGVRAALQGGLVEDLDWLAPSAAGTALYEIASALPLGAERRDLGRRVLARLLDGNAEVFVAIATRMARTTGKGFANPGVRARVALVTELPIGLGVGDGALALALAARRELAREWIDLPSTGSLPSRRLAARLLERAAREAARRAAQGDVHALRAFRVDAVQKAYDRLLKDRESLVWRHVAVARGLLAPWVPELQAELDGGLAPNLSPTEWRRAATSLAAELAVEPDRALRALESLAGVLERDPGAGAALVWGIPRAAEAEPELAERVLNDVLGRAPALVAEAVIELRAELGSAALVDRAFSRSLEIAAKHPVADRGDDGADAMAREVLRDLDRSPRDDEPLREQLAGALALFASGGARAAYAAAREALDSARDAMDTLAAVSNDDDQADTRAGSLARRASLAVLRDLDISLLERNVLSNLLDLGTSQDAIRVHDEALDTIRARLSEWILVRESTPLLVNRDSATTSSVAHPTLRLRRLRALLHLVDGDSGDLQEDEARAARLRDRWRLIAKALTTRFEKEGPSVLHRTISAALARSLDALVRAGACDLSDVLLVVGREETDPPEFETLAEASMDPDLVHVFTRYARFLRVCATSSTSDPSWPDVPAQLGAFEELAQEIIPDGSGRREALRTVLVRLHNALAVVANAPSLRALSTTGASEPDAVVALEVAVAELGHVAAGARARLEPMADAAIAQASTAGEHDLSLAVSRVLSGADPALQGAVVDSWVKNLAQRVPAGMARVIATAVRTLADRPVERPSLESSGPKLSDGQLPSWLPARRTLGGFYVVRPLGAGAVGSVFVVNRIEDRQDPLAERFALKVPDYSATAARSLSEAEFMRLFRDEASALMAVPTHDNLARFVTFDLAARPKPILVMELVEGMMLERTIASRALEMPRAIDVLDDVLAGLEAMHGVGVGHLDLKPSNVVLRKGDQAVLVDFGLAGRHIRPGCATGPYGAPEVWGVLPDGYQPLPMLADVYAFGCLAFETLTGRVLFDADNQMAQIALHIAHDGMPPPLRELADRGDLAALVDLLSSTLRRDPRHRPAVPSLRAQLRSIRPILVREPWPLGASGASTSMPALPLLARRRIAR
jgi:hypothetical protein